MQQFYPILLAHMLKVPSSEINWKVEKKIGRFLSQSFDAYGSDLISSKAYYIEKIYKTLCSTLHL